jgi:hypothetical protein
VGLKVAETQFHPESFGNALVVLDGRNVRLRFLRDRGETFLEVSARDEGSQWHAAQRALRAVTGAADVPEGPLGLDDAADFLERNLEILEEGFATAVYSRTAERLRFLDNQAVHEFMREAGLETK